MLVKLGKRSTVLFMCSQWGLWRGLKPTVDWLLACAREAFECISPLVATDDPYSNMVDLDCKKHHDNTKVVAKILHDNSVRGWNVTLFSLCVRLWTSNSTYTPFCCQEVSIREVLAGSCYIFHIREEVRIVLMQVKVEELTRHMRTLNNKLGNTLLLVHY